MERITIKRFLNLGKRNITGKIFSFATDTVYAIGALYDDVMAINKIYQIKNRSRQKPMANLCSNISQIEDMGIIIPVMAQDLMTKYWPGPLTIIFQYKNKKISFRMPDCFPALKIINYYGIITATSANDSGAPELNDYLQIKNKFELTVDYFIDYDWPLSGRASTVVDVSGNQMKIIREGNIKL